MRKSAELYVLPPARQFQQLWSVSPFSTCDQKRVMISGSRFKARTSMSALLRIVILLVSGGYASRVPSTCPLCVVLPFPIGGMDRRLLPRRSHRRVTDDHGLSGRGPSFTPGMVHRPRPIPSSASAGGGWE